MPLKNKSLDAREGGEAAWVFHQREYSVSAPSRFADHACLTAKFGIGV
jgi:hypothetical protein